MSRIGRALISSDDATGSVTLPSAPDILPTIQGGTGQDTSTEQGIPHVQDGTWEFDEAIELKTEAAATSMRIDTGDGGTSGILVQPEDTDNISGQIAVAPKGTVTTPAGTSAMVSGVRVFFDDPADYATVSDHQAICFEAHLDADGNYRGRIVSRASGTGTTFKPFYFQMGGYNSLYISETGIVVSGPASGPGYWDWTTTNCTPGDLVIGRNGRDLRTVNTAKDDTYHLIGGDNGDRTRIDSNGGGIYAGTTPTQLTDSAGRVRHPEVATADLPSAGAAQNGLILIEDAGPTDQNIIVYARGQRFRIDGGTAF